MELAELIQVLGRLEQSTIRSKAPSRRDEYEARSVFDALQSLIVSFPKDKVLLGDAVEVLRPLIDQFGSTGDTLPVRTKSMIDNAVAVSDDKAFWSRVFENGASMTQRLGLESPKPKAPATNLHSKQNKAVYQFASLLLAAIQPMLGELVAEGRRGSLGDAPWTSSTDGGDTPSARIYAALALDPRSLDREYSTTIAGEVDSWYLSVLKAKTAQHPMPDTSVIVSGIVEDIRFEQNGNQYLLSEVDQLRDLERFLLRRYDMTSDQLVVEVARIAIQDCGDYYRDPASVETAITAVLSQTWVFPWDPRNSMRVAAVLDRQTSMAMWIRHSDLKTHAKDHGLELDTTERRNMEIYMSHHLDYLVGLHGDLLTNIGLPAIIARWLEGAVGHDREVFFNPGMWRLVLD